MNALTEIDDLSAFYRASKTQEIESLKDAYQKDQRTKRSFHDKIWYIQGCTKIIDLSGYFFSVLLLINLLAHAKAASIFIFIGPSLLISILTYFLCICCGSEDADLKRPVYIGLTSWLTWHLFYGRYVRKNIPTLSSGIDFANPTVILEVLKYIKVYAETKQQKLLNQINEQLDQVRKASFNINQLIQSITDSDNILAHARIEAAEKILNKLKEQEAILQEQYERADKCLGLILQKYNQLNYAYNVSTQLETIACNYNLTLELDMAIEENQQQLEELLMIVRNSEIEMASIAELVEAQNECSS